MKVSEMKYTMIDDRIYKVVACWHCPFHLCSIDACYCNHPEEYRRHAIDITKTFPDWCPLKEVDE